MNKTIRGLVVCGEIALFDCQIKKQQGENVSLYFPSERNSLMICKQKLGEICAIAACGNSNIA